MKDYCKECLCFIPHVDEMSAEEIDQLYIAGKISRKPDNCSCFLGNTGCCPHDDEIMKDQEVKDFLHQYQIKINPEM